MESAVGVLLAGGHGTLRKDRSVSKLLEPIQPNSNVPLIRLPYECLKKRLKLETVVVTNGRYGHDIRCALAEHTDDHFVHQPFRSGAAGAVKLVLEHFKQNGIQNRSTNI